MYTEMRQTISDAWRTKQKHLCPVMMFCNDFIYSMEQWNLSTEHRIVAFKELYLSSYNYHMLLYLPDNKLHTCTSALEYSNAELPVSSTSQGQRPKHSWLSLHHTIYSFLYNYYLLTWMGTTQLFSDIKRFSKILILLLSVLEILHCTHAHTLTETSNKS